MHYQSTGLIDKTVIIFNKELYFVIVQFTALTYILYIQNKTTRKMPQNPHTPNYQKVRNKLFVPTLYKMEYLTIPSRSSSSKTFNILRKVDLELNLSFKQ